MRALFVLVILCAAPSFAQVFDTPAKATQPNKKVVKPTPQKLVPNRPVNVEAQNQVAIEAMKPPSEATVNFMNAVVNRNFEVADVYLAQGADINCINNNNYPLTGISLLHYAISNWSGENGIYGRSVATYLLNHGANINIRNSEGFTPLMFAAGIQNYPDALSATQFLLSSGAKTGMIGYDGKTTAMDFVYTGWNYNQSGKNKFSELIRLLQSIGEDVNHQNRSGNTRLMSLSNRCGSDDGADEFIRALLEAGANPQIKNNNNQNALDLALSKAASNPRLNYCIGLLQSRVNVAPAPSPYTRNAAIQNAASTNASSNSHNVPLPNTGAVNNNQSTTSTSSGGIQISNRNFIGTFYGKYSGDDHGIFKAEITSDGQINLTGKSEVLNQYFTGKGEVDENGKVTVTLGSVSSGASFVGRINPNTGDLSGTWQNTSLIGNFYGSNNEPNNNIDARPNPIEAVGNVLNSINKIFGK